MGEPAEEIIAHVRHDQALAPKDFLASQERLVIQVVLHLLVEEVRLADEEVRAAGGLGQRIGPFGVAGVGDDLFATPDP